MAFDNPLAGEIWSSKYRFAPPEAAGDATVRVDVVDDDVEWAADVACGEVVEGCE